ncbi:MAG: hypothetical protein JKX76_03370 [Colwellia sp.]|nr:hypothetical protein [Colwellia sp.]
MDSASELDKIIVPGDFEQMYMPFYQFSTRELAKIRLHELKNLAPWPVKARFIINGFLNENRLNDDSTGIEVELVKTPGMSLDLRKDSSSYSIDNFPNSIGLIFSFRKITFWTDYFTYDALSGLEIEIRILEHKDNSEDGVTRTYEISEFPSGHGRGRFITIQ